MASHLDHARHKKRRVECLSETAEKKDADEIVRLLDMAPVASSFSDMKDTVACAICQADVMCDPQLMTMCGHSFCKTCLEKKEQYGTCSGICPTCRKGSAANPNAWVHNISLTKVIDSMKYMCPCCEEDSSSSRCKSDTTMYSKMDLKEHLRDKCPNRKRMCAVPGCGAMLLPNEVDEHNRANGEVHLKFALGACDEYERKLKDLQERNKEMIMPDARAAVSNSTANPIEAFHQPRGYVFLAKPTLCVPSDEYPTVESAYRAIFMHHLCGIIQVGPGTFDVGLEINYGNVTIIGTMGGGGERLTKLESVGCVDVLLCTNLGTSVTLVNLEVHHRRRNSIPSSQSELVRSNEAVACDNGCEVRLINCRLSSMSGPAVSAGLYTREVSTGRLSHSGPPQLHITRLCIEKCEIDNCPVGDAVLLTGRFKVAVRDCVLHGSKNGIQAWVAPLNRTICTVLVKDTLIKQYRHRALFLKYEKFMTPLPNWQDRSLNEFCVFTLDNVSVDMSATELNVGEDNPVYATMMEYKNSSGRDATMWFGPPSEEPHFCVRNLENDHDDGDDEDGEPYNPLLTIVR